MACTWSLETLFLENMNVTDPLWTFPRSCLIDVPMPVRRSTAPAT